MKVILEFFSFLPKNIFASNSIIIQLSSFFIVTKVTFFIAHSILLGGWLEGSCSTVLNDELKVPRERKGLFSWQRSTVIAVVVEAFLFKLCAKHLSQIEKVLQLKSTTVLSCAPISYPLCSQRSPTNLFWVTNSCFSILIALKLSKLDFYRFDLNSSLFGRLSKSFKCKQTQNESGRKILLSKIKSFQKVLINKTFETIYVVNLGKWLQSINFPNKH